MIPFDPASAVIICDSVFGLTLQKSSPRSERMKPARKRCRLLSAGNGSSSRVTTFSGTSLPCCRQRAGTTYSEKQIMAETGFSGLLGDGPEPRFHTGFTEQILNIVVFAG